MSAWPADAEQYARKLREFDQSEPLPPRRCRRSAAGGHTHRRVSRERSVRRRLNVHAGHCYKYVVPAVRPADATAARICVALLVLLCTCALGACGSTTVSEVTAPSNARCEPSIAGLPASVDAEGGEFEATVAIARECNWTLASDAAWARVTPDHGQGEAPVVIVVTPNPAAINRTAALTLNSTKTSLRQDAAPCRLAWKESSLDVPAAGGTVSLGLSATTGCEWQATSNASWLRGTATRGVGDGAAVFVASENDGDERTATVRLGDASAIVTQAAAAATPAPLPPGSPLPPVPPVPPAPPAPPPPPVPLVATYVGAASGMHNFDASGALSLPPGSYQLTFNRAATIYVRGAAGGGGGGGGKRRDDGGSVTAGGGGGGGGAASLSGQAVSVVAGTTYEAVVGSGGAGGAGATEASGNIAGSGQAGTSTSFRIQGSTVYLQLAGGTGGAAGTNAAGPGGPGGSVSVGPGVPGGAGGDGGVFVGPVAQPGGGIAGVTTGGGGGGGQSNELGSSAGGATGAPGGASGGAPGVGGRGGDAASGAADSGAGGEGAHDSLNNDSAGGGGGGGKGVTLGSGASNRGGGGGGGGAINTSNSRDRAGNGGAGGAGGMSIAIQP